MKFHIKYLLLICVLLVGASFNSVWADNTITWEINGVNTSANNASVNTTLKTSSVTGGSGTWTAISTGSSYAGSNSGAQLGSGNYSFNGTISLSSSSIPSSAVITEIQIYARAGGSYSVSASVNGNTFGSSATVNSTTSSYKTFSGNSIGNNIVLTLSTSEKKYFAISKIKVTYVSPCVSPVFSEISGTELVKGTDVIITSTTTGSTIYYTMDGTTPSSSSPNHGVAGDASATVTVNGDVTIKAIAVKDGLADSEVSTASFTVPRNNVGSFSAISDQAVVKGESTDFNPSDYYTDDAGVTGTTTFTVMPTTGDIYYSGGRIYATAYGSQEFTVTATPAVADEASYKAVSTSFTVNCPDTRTAVNISSFTFAQDVTPLII